MDPVVWTVRAVNLPEHAHNAIHTDEGARAAGFPGALVAGVTTYAYLTHPLAAAWGEDWLVAGGGELRLASPVFEADLVHCTPRVDAEQVVVEALVDAPGDSSGAPRATLRGWLGDPGAVVTGRPGDHLVSRSIALEGEWDAYGRRAGDDLELYDRLGITHPAVWPALANHIVHTQVARGSWIHTRSRIQHHATAPAGASVDVHAVVVDRFVKPSGERAVLEVRIEHAGATVVTIEHEAIVALPGA
jgi:hypothetical protein